ncbi:MAG: 50S ribosomal protein L29 [Vampirovibrionales bacterium]|nr:50S ribosomal protein L29 [Vampirovibrionales bacterium]
MSIAELREMSAEELNRALAEAGRELFEMRFKKAQAQLENPARLRGMRHRIAQIKTVQREQAVAGGNQ